MTDTRLDTAFDAAAERYDLEEAANWIVGRMRLRSLALLRRTFPPGWRLLDVGAGTGTEAVALAAEGRELVAVDPSPAMLDRLGAKARAAGVSIPVHMLPARRLTELVEAYGDGRFDGAYSSFGALNGEPDLEPVADGLARLIRPGGHLVVSLMGGWPVPEMVLHVLRLRPREAFRRRRGTILVPVSAGVRSPTHFHRPRQLKDAFAAGFTVEHEAALALLLPPPYSWPRLHRWTTSGRASGTLEALDWLDGHISGFGPLADLGDHHLTVMRRRQ